MLIWVGRFYSDIIFSEYLFAGAITVYSYDGKKKLPCFSYLKNDSKETVSFLDQGFKEFVLVNMKNSIKQNSECHFLFYSDILASSIIEEYPHLETYIVSVNRKQHAWLRSKVYSRIWLQDIVKLPGLDIITKNECSVGILKSRFPGYEQFIVQENVSSGGHGTFLLNDTTEDNIHEKLDPELYYVVSPYIEDSESINIHVFISAAEILVFPYSFQNIMIINWNFMVLSSIQIGKRNKKYMIHLSVLPENCRK